MEKWYKRFYEQEFPGLLTAGKVLLVYGPRRSGKTSLIKHFLSNYQGKYYTGAGLLSKSS